MSQVCRRTDAEHDDEDDEGVGHGEDGRRHRRDHLLQPLRARVCVGVCVCARACVCVRDVCVCERERERENAVNSRYVCVQEREAQRRSERGREEDADTAVIIFFSPCIYKYIYITRTADDSDSV